jgi:hypothetical protein
MKKTQTVERINKTTTMVLSTKGIAIQAEILFKSLFFSVLFSLPR